MRKTLWKANGLTAIPLHPKEKAHVRTYVHTKPCMQIFIAALFVICLYAEATQMSSWRNGWTWVYPYNAVLLISKQKWTIKTGCSTDEFQINYWVEEARHSTYSMSSFTWSPRKYKLIYSSRKQISGCLKMVGEMGWHRRCIGTKGNFGGVINIFIIFFCGAGFTGVCVCVYVKLCSLLCVYFISIGLLKIQIAPPKQHCLQNCSPFPQHPSRLSLRTLVESVEIIADLLILCAQHSCRILRNIIPPRSQAIVWIYSPSQGSQVTVKTSNNIIVVAVVLLPN